MTTRSPAKPKRPSSTRKSADRPKLYDALAPWWPLMSAPADYAEEAASYQRVLIETSERPCHSVLELGSGGGNNASHLKARFTMALVEPAPGMLGVSRALNPDCEHIAGDMRTVRLDRRFDAVFVHDAITYMTTEDDLRQAMATAFAHCQPGGAAIFAPDYVRETFRPSTDHGGHDGTDRALRYLEWTWDPDPNDNTYFVDYTYLLRYPDGSMHVKWDRHVEGLFSRAHWLALLSEAGFEPTSRPLDHSEVAAGSHEIFACVRPF